MTSPSPKSRGAALALCVLIGVFGAHRFYAGRILSGLIYLLTGGLLGIGCFVDLIFIIVGTFKDGEGRAISNW